MADRDHHITLAQAMAYTHAWQQAHPGERRAWMLPREIIDEILKQPGCTGIRVYAGNVAGDERLVWVGTDVEGNDLTSGPIAEECQFCPPFCAPSSALLTPAR